MDLFTFNEEILNGKPHFYAVKVLVYAVLTRKQAKVAFLALENIFHTVSRSLFGLREIMKDKKYLSFYTK